MPASRENAPLPDPRGLGTHCSSEREALFLNYLSYNIDTYNTEVCLLLDEVTTPWNEH